MRRLAVPKLPTRATIALAAAVLLSVPLVLGLFGRVDPALDSFAHFRVHLAVALIVAALLLVFMRAWREGLVALALAAGALATTLPHGAWGGTATAQAFSPGGDAPTYRLLHLNLRFDHPEPARVLSLIARERPDVITLNEVSRHWEDSLRPIAAAYPHRLICENATVVGGVAILSRRPFVDGAVRHCVSGGRLAVAGVDFGGRAVAVVAVHLGWPWPFEQAGQIEDLAPLLAALGEESLLAGDFNATPWSAALRRFVASGGFAQPVRLGPTWLTPLLPAALRGVVGLPIDHVMVKKGIVLGRLATLGDVGSDHLPVLAEFSVRSEPGIGTVAVAAHAD